MLFPSSSLDLNNHSFKLKIMKGKLWFIIVGKMFLQRNITEEIVRERNMKYISYILREIKECYDIWYQNCFNEKKTFLAYVYRKSFECLKPLRSEITNN